MDSDEERSVHEERVGDHDSDAATSHFRGSPGNHSAADQSDGESSYAPSDQSVDINANHSASGIDDYPASSSPLKRPAEQASTDLPFKRRKGVVNAGYLDLLNREIDDAAHRVCLEENVDLPGSQIGLTSWSTVEKQQFFEAVSRLGKYDLPGIASRIGSKSVVEVKQYVDLFQAAKDGRQCWNRRSYLEPAEYPAAVEISQQCCHAQEEAADSISVCQEQREKQREALKWGQNWHVTSSLARRLNHRGGDGDPTSEATLKFSQLFHLSNWLKLSERFFMNSSIPGNNWNYIDVKRPSMWATAFDDFHSLAVSVTRRLVQTTLFISMSRIKTKKELIPTTRDIVRTKDVEAAIASLAMPHDSKSRWIESARRLRLDVYDEPPDKDDDDPQEEPMTYEEVEAILSGIDDDSNETPAPSNAIFVHGAGLDEGVEEDDEDDDCDPVIDSETGIRPEAGIDDGKYEIAQEANEILIYSAPELKDIQTAKQALVLRITTERQQEAQADLHDEYASYQAETEMWNILQEKPPMELPKVQDPGRVHRSNLDVENVYRLGGDWASKLEYYGEWETLDGRRHEE
ncbi:Homeodomain-like protein [Metarhizium album ARSEF 1941]|uniref:Homeodomain-like protein n=1 Tax=Metarhizium album (strain ARSEF 1941) TaxID=1081103 RepID=A0A0B2WXM2_METAS|nr:Homeodomain-like protein [Metarhizium album ARSEF 1941]KHN98172.1 Homeodomain-like protein [Metarhizium album ARSEF 1941]